MDQPFERSGRGDGSRRSRAMTTGKIRRPSGEEVSFSLSVWLGLAGIALTMLAMGAGLMVAFFPTKVEMVQAVAAGVDKHEGRPYHDGSTPKDEFKTLDDEVKVMHRKLDVVIDRVGGREARERIDEEAGRAH